ncbi:ABC transporter permease [Mycoplasmatota bacterium]|nr:ABC transporter permease [Mycoplasmatota bacterium]
MSKTELLESKAHEKILSPTQLMINKFKSNKLAMAGLITFIIIVLLIIGTQLYIKFTGYPLGIKDPSVLGGKYESPNAEFWFGTDKQGRNYFIRVLAGGWLSLLVAILATVLQITIGMFVGAVAGFFGGRIDNILMRITEIVSSFPFIAIAMTISFLFIDMPEESRLFIMVFILGILRWTGLARMVRGQILSLREQEFIVAAKALGISTRHQITRHLLPNVVAYVIVSATIGFATAILAEATLAFLGLSVAEPVPTWGSLIQRVKSTSMGPRWWLWVFPGGLLVMFIMSVNLIGEGLRDAVDPKAVAGVKNKVNGWAILAKFIVSILLFFVFSVFVSILLLFVVWNVESIYFFFKKYVSKNEVNANG